MPIMLDDKMRRRRHRPWFFLCAKGCNGIVVQLLVQLMVQLHPMHPRGYGPGYLQHNFVHALLLPYNEGNINSLGAEVQHNFRRTLLMPSREGEYQ